MSERNPYRQRNDGGRCECSSAPSLRDPGCGRTFGGLSGFDAHLIAEHPNGSPHGNRCHCSDWWPRCATDAELEAKGYAPDARGWWRSPDVDARWVPHVGTETGVQARKVAGAQ